jgi:acyl-CoA synthetase (NDP forming)
VARRKPIVAVKSGRTVSGARAASSHTGSLAGSDAAVAALFHQSGVIRTDTIEELFDTALLLAYQPVPKGPRVAILTNAGGPGIMAADACESAGLELPELAPATVKALRAFLPAEASVKNPVDMIASANAPSYEKALRLLVADESVDSVIVIFVPPLVTGAMTWRGAILAGGKGSVEADPLLLHGIARHSGEPEVPQRGTHSVLCIPEAAARTVARVAKYGVWREGRPGEVPKLKGVDSANARAAIERSLPDGWVAPGALQEILQAYGIRTPDLRAAANRGEAASAAKAIGFPVAIKVKSPDVVHKTDVGGVKLGLASEEEAARAFDEIKASLAKAMPKARFEGVTVEAMVAGGIETIVGMSRDPLFGPVVLFGLGGVSVEVLRDITVRVAPITDRDAEEMVSEIRGSALFKGYRGAPPVNTAPLLDLLHRVSRLAIEQPEIQELDLNPVVVFLGIALASRSTRACVSPRGRDRDQGRGSGGSDGGHRRAALSPVERRDPRIAPKIPREAKETRGWFSRVLFGFRPEEVMTLVFFVPLVLALAAMSRENAILPGPAATYPGSFVRLLALVASTMLFLWIVRYRPQWEFARDAMPFVFCANVYANLYDLIRFFNMRDITQHLYRWDVALFGVEPTVWAERFIAPVWTDFFTVCYWLFYVCAPVMGLVLYLNRDRKAFRYTMGLCGAVPLHGLCRLRLVARLGPRLAIRSSTRSTFTAIPRSITRAPRSRPCP